MKLKTVLLAVGCVLSTAAGAQHISGEYNGEFDWDFNNRTNFVNLLRLDADWSPWKNGTLELATLHVARTNDPVIDDLQVFSNIYEENCVAAIAVLNYHHAFPNANIYVGVRNMNEDFFVSDMTSFFTSSSPGIFPTIGGSYPIANYPVSSLTFTFDYTFCDYFTVRNAVYAGVGYNGWKHNDNPFRINKSDGFMDVLELTYETEKNFYSVGAAMHTKEFRFDADGEELGRSNKFSAGIWAYGEQDVWNGDDQRLRLMAQVSFNTNSHAQCTSYGEVGIMYENGSNAVGLSGQYGRFHEAYYDRDGKDGYGYYGMDEFSVEASWSHEFNEHVSIQPAIHYVHSDGKDNVAFLGRLTLAF